VSQVLSRTETETEELGSSNLNMRKIVVAIDLTPRSKKTAAYAAEFAKRLNAALTLVHVFAPEPITEFTSEQAHEAVAEGRRQTLAKLAKLIENLRRSGVECHDDFRVGDPAEEIALAARAIDADLIITASHHPGFLGRTLGLDQAPRIFHRASCPVLVYQAEAAGNSQ
jgi:nucleotide-binding universal stress UspA family protein